MTADELEALSRKYSNDVVIILPLKSTRWAVFDNQRRLCAVVEAGEVQKAVMEVVARKLAEIPLPGTKEWYSGDPTKRMYSEAFAWPEGNHSEINLEELEL